MTALYRNRSDRFSDLWKGIPAERFAIALLIPKSDRFSFCGTGDRFDNRKLRGVGVARRRHR
ncbi:hypothetical protein [Aphanizomenon flos-aquae]|uniref:Uncharacterized protein n=1 Tax=Aphanizomenon flos-aquae FACHB-1040 TaxID=2692887 RepID=A0ABR8C339_APHFL|nr:hypothetical protein [Aphanizomenon flos-aquae]MBD2281447.1 hypothetical protein [Aphanizomenon flos-aquae FACHB-1040]